MRWKRERRKKQGANAKKTRQGKEILAFLKVIKVFKILYNFN